MSHTTFFYKRSCDRSVPRACDFEGREAGNYSGNMPISEPGILKRPIIEEAGRTRPFLANEEPMAPFQLCLKKYARSEDGNRAWVVIDAFTIRSWNDVLR
jgi:hypothetical protein